MKNQICSEKYPESVGFLNTVGAHTSRTIMFKELVLLFNNTDKNTSLEDIRKKVYIENILQKKSISGREKTFGFLKKIYSLDKKIQLYNAFRWTWNISNERERSLLAMLCALARDASLRISAPYILSLSPGEIVTKEEIMELIETSFPNRFSLSVIDSMALNILSSWKQSGHLKGTTKKIRVKANSDIASCIFALAVGYLAGYRGRLLLDTLWIQTLDATDYEIQEYLQRAMKKGWIQFRQSAGMMEINFPNDIFGEKVRV